MEAKLRKSLIPVLVALMLMMLCCERLPRAQQTLAEDILLGQRDAMRCMPWPTPRRERSDSLTAIRCIRVSFCMFRPAIRWIPSVRASRRAMCGTWWGCISLRPKR